MMLRPKVARKRYFGRMFLALLLGLVTVVAYVIFVLHVQFRHSSAEPQQPVRCDTASDTKIRNQLRTTDTIDLENATDTGKKIEIKPNTNVEFPIMLATAARSQGRFYLDQTIEALKSRGVPAEAITILNVEQPGHHPLFEEYNRSQLQNKYAVEVIQRERSAGLVPNNPLGLKLPVRLTPGAIQASRDDAARKAWRSSEALDFLQVGRHALARFPSAVWFLFLQDDAVCNRDSTTQPLSVALRNRIDTDPDAKKGLVRLNPNGNVAIMFHRQLLEGFLGFTALNFDLIPIDWLLDQYLASVGVKETSKWRKEAHMCTHIGKVSSFAGNAIRKET